MAGNRNGGRPACEECAADAEFWLYDADAGRWWPACERDALAVHPSIEIRAWIESGYLRPAELGEPADPPPDPRDPREAAFRELVDDAMGW